MFWGRGTPTLLRLGGQPTVRCCPLSAAAGRAGPPSGRGRGRSARPGVPGPGTSLAPLPPSQELAGASRLGLTSSLCSLPQAETPLITTCRQNAPPAAGYHCPARRSPGAAVRLHDRQRECPAGGPAAGAVGIQSSPKARAS